MRRDPYQVLALRRDASDEDITRRFRRLAMETHPDRNLGRNTTPQFLEVREAYDTLIDPIRRAEYEVAHARARATNQTQRTTASQRQRTVDDDVACPACDALDAFLRDADQRLTPSKAGVLNLFDALDGIAKKAFRAPRCGS